MLFKFKNHLCLSETILCKEFPFSISCDLCTDIELLCITMSGHSKCTECVCQDHLCIDLSLNSLESTYIKVEHDLFEALDEQLSQLLAWIIWLCKVLKQTENCIDTKVTCLTQELADNNDGTENDTPQMLSQFLDQMSNKFWQSVSSLSQTAATFLHSFWDSLLVLKLTLRYCILFTWQDSELFH